MTTPAAAANSPTRTRLARPARQTRRACSVIESLPCQAVLFRVPTYPFTQARWSYAEQMAEVALVTDSTSSLTPEEARSAGVTVVPLQVIIDGESRPESAVPAAEVAAALRAGRTVTTSRPSPEAFAAAYAELAASGATAVVSVH